MLPKELFVEICKYIDIHELKYLLDIKYFNSLTELDFWTKYFAVHELNIKTVHNSFDSWITEFNVANVLKDLENIRLLPSSRCTYIFRRGNNKCQQCPKNNYYGCGYCDSHMMKHNYHLKYIISNTDIKNTLCIRFNGGNDGINETNNINVAFKLNDEVQYANYIIENLYNYLFVVLGSNAIEKIT